MGKNANLLGGIIAGAGAMYLLDPDRGRRRRATVGDRFRHASHAVDDAADTTRRDLRNRVQGVVAEARGRLRRDDPDDRVLAERVRSAIGRASSHPSAIEVQATQGTVTLFGPVLRHELDEVVDAVRSVRGVRRVQSRLEPHERPGDISGLQGGRPRPRQRRFEYMQENWAPAPRLLAGMSGIGLTAWGSRLGGPLRAALTVAGGALLTRALTNLPFKRLTGVTGGRRAIELQKSINVAAPVDRVFDFWSRFENFPRFMSHLREVRSTGDGRSRWVAAGPLGTSLEWDAEVVEWVPNRLIRWRSMPGSTVGTAGTIRFLPNEHGGTRVDVHLCYNPPAGAIGHTLAAWFGADPKHAMDEDLVRFKSLIEEGRTSAGGRNIRREEVIGNGARRA